MLALDISSGTQRLSFPAQGEKPLEGIYGTPAVDNGMVFFGGYDGRFYALDASTLNKKWQYPADESQVGGIVGGSVVAGDLVLFGSSDGYITALQKSNGLLVWRYKTKGMVWSTPTVVDQTVYVGSLDHNVYALSLADGTPRWAAPFRADGAVVTSPLVADGKVFFGSFDRSFYAVDASTGTQVWRFQGTAWFWSTPVTDGKRVYAADMTGKLYALDMASGAQKWGFNLEHPVLSTPALVGNNLVVTSDGGLVQVISTETGQQVSPSFNVGAQVRAPLGVRDGVVYINTMDRRVWALKVVGGQEKLWEVTAGGTG